MVIDGARAAPPYSGRVHTDTGAESVSRPTPAAQPTADLSTSDLADRLDIPEAVVDVLYREGLLAATSGPDGPRFSEGDVDAITAGIALLDAGVPLDELLDVARRWDEAARTLADEAVEMFLRFVRDPIQGSAASDQEASQRLTTAFQQMFPATGRIVAHHFRGVLFERAAGRIRSDGDAEELAALAEVVSSPDADA